ncbi:MAG: DUF3048 domain-containing protein [Acidimicrobiia bacterium]|nr:DUF3048 domain-containing protein [Acidimicrobiia bacterium]
MRRIVVMLVAFAAVSSACSGEAEVTTTTPPPVATTVTVAPTTTAPGPTATTTTTAPVGPGWPLTGEPVEGADTEGVVLVAKIDNTSNSRPQLGLDAADMVIEVLVEGGIPRLLAFFQSTIPEEVGPIRSAREVDPKLLLPFGALFAYSGGETHVVSAVREVTTDVGFADLGSEAYYRADDRPSLYDIVLRTGDVITAQPPPAPQGQWLTFGPTPTGGEQALSVELHQSSLNIVNYRYSTADGGYLRFNGETPATAVGSSQLVADNVIVMFVEVIDTGRTDSSGSKVPDYQVLGEGDVVVFRDGRVFPGAWERFDQREFFSFVTAAGREIPLAPGTTWIELVPVGRLLTWK